MAKFDWKKFGQVVAMVAPVVLIAVPGGQVLAPLVPVFTHAITEAEQMKGATGAEKKAHVMSIVQAAVTIANSSGKVTLDQAAVEQAASHGVDAVIGTVKIIEGSKVATPAPAA